MKVIFDTNVALNLWFFKDAATLAALSTLRAKAQAYGTPAMLAELERVARSPHLAKYANAGKNSETRNELNADDALGALTQQWCSNVACEEAEPTARSPLRCRDLDDQVFLDLAHQLGAMAIVTLDRDLLKLSKRAATLGLRIATPFHPDFAQN